MDNKLSNLDKLKLLRQEYRLLAKEVDASFISLQAKASMIVAVYAFIFSGYIIALSRWQDFTQANIIIVFEAVLFIGAMICIIYALLIVKRRKWRSFGDPIGAAKKLNKAATLAEYYFGKLDDWQTVVENNKKINEEMNIWLLWALGQLGLIISLIMFHIVLTVL